MRPSLLAIALGPVALFTLPSFPACAEESTDPGAPVPAWREFHRHVLAVMKSYPADGTHRYWWPKGSDWAGNTRDLHYEGEIFSKGDPEGRSYCCGLTFEVFFRAWEAWAQKGKIAFSIGDLDAGRLREFRSRWFCAGDFRRGPLDALEWAKGLGYAVDPAEARPGDFVQIWRRSGSGHSVVFRGWTRDRAGGVIGLRYWSTQNATDGIGERTESVVGDSGVDLEKTSFARVGRKRS